jgi:hypothetical protein
MNQARGLLTVTGPSGTVTRETFTCCHCNGVDLTPAPGATEVGFCNRCFARECVPCAKRLGGRCTPFEMRLEAYERRQRMLVAITG